MSLFQFRRTSVFPSDRATGDLSKMSYSYRWIFSQIHLISSTNVDFDVGGSHRRLFEKVSGAELLRGL